jgi:hypothetical protein
MKDFPGIKKPGWRCRACDQKDERYQCRRTAIEKGGYCKICNAIATGETAAKAEAARLAREAKIERAALAGRVLKTLEADRLDTTLEASIRLYAANAIESSKEPA